MSTKELPKDLINKFSILNGTSSFSSGVFQNYLEFIPAEKYIKYFSGATRFHLWKSNGMSEENIRQLTKYDNNFAPILLIMMFYQA